MRLVVVLSPYRGDIEGNKAYARSAMHDCFMRGEAPLASHLLYTQKGILDNGLAFQRDLGIRAGIEWAARADATVAYVDYGITEGMREEIDAAEAAGARLSTASYTQRSCQVRPLKLTIEVEQLAFGRVFSRLDGMPGVVSIHLHGRGPAASTTKAPKRTGAPWTAARRKKFIATMKRKGAKK